MDCGLEVGYERFEYCCYQWVGGLIWVDVVSVYEMKFHATGE